MPRATAPGPFEPDARTRLVARMVGWFGPRRLRGVLSAVRLSAPYFDADLGFVVRDARRHDFATRDSIRRLGKVALGLPVRDASLELGLRDYLEGIDVRFEDLGSPYEFLVGWRDDVDAFVTFAASGAAWSLLHPEYSVVVPQPPPMMLTEVR